VLPLTVKLPVIVTLLLTVVVPVDAPIATVVAAPPMFNVVTVALKTEAVVLLVEIAGEAPLILRVVAFARVTVALRIVCVPVVAPTVVAVEAPKALTVVAVVLNTACVVFVPTTVPGFIVRVAAVALPKVIAVAAPNAFTVVDVVFQRLTVV
jgi:hypothetical protein